eukprot:TRINITY_DN36904_c0_g1_i1.p1 TRINITY_DN36904_c0_g1~~TRINITY_DN36904_c0_g1_i1.p1  ORF type:complete len:136 (+),score=37.57 TRINITY_DN36904_c0_g1_i1:56-409(+)
MGLLTGMIHKWPAEFLCKSWLVVCGYKSFKAIESTDKCDDTQWLTFWMVMSLVQFAEFWTDILRKFVPYYNEAKLAFIVWLSLMKGAHMIYDKALRPFLKEKEQHIDQHVAPLTEKM